MWKLPKTVGRHVWMSVCCEGWMMIHTSLSREQLELHHTDAQFKFPAKPDVGWCWPRGMLLLPWRQAKVLLKSITGDYCLLGTFWVSLVHLGTLKPLISVVRRWWVASCPKLYPPSCLMSLSAVLNIHVGLCYIITLFQHVCAVAGRAAMLTKIFAVWYATDKRSL